MDKIVEQISLFANNIYVQMPTNTRSCLYFLLVYNFSTRLRVCWVWGNVFQFSYVLLVKFLENIFSWKSSSLKMKKMTSLVEVGKTISTSGIPHLFSPPHLQSMMPGLFKHVNGCMLNSTKVVYFWKIRHGCDIESDESMQLSLQHTPSPPSLPPTITPTSHNICPNYIQMLSG